MKLRTNRLYLNWIKAGLLSIFSSFWIAHVPAQSLFSIELTHPSPYESRTLASEKSTTTNFSLPKKFFTNTTSRFNYYFNANNELNDLITSYKEQHIDDYTQLLSFYNYAFDSTAKDLMDTVIYRCTAGILLHDLRSDWVDKLFLLLGKAYLYRKDFDSATTVFQYINYAFAPKDNGYDIPIGSNASNTKGVFTIATREDRSFWKNISSFPPSRNESYIWQVRTYIEQDQLSDAATLLEIIRTDPNFPERLRTDFHEMNAYLLYKQKSYEGAAFHLTKALGNAENNFEKARWEYLAAQLYQLSHKDDLAITLFEQSIQHTTDPLIEVYARLNIVSLATSNQENAIQKNIDELLKMAKRDKYQSYRDIIYYAAAVLDLQRKNYNGAQSSLLKSIKYNEEDPLQRQKSFLLLGDLNYTRKAYSQSYAFYDSIQVASLKEPDQLRVEERKPALKIITENELIIQYEDSLQKLASLPPDIRNELVKKLYKKILKEKGIKEASVESNSFGSNFPASATSGSLFTNAAGSDFYFQNASQKAKGMVEFKARWGNRPNVDNWRRQSAVAGNLNNTAALNSVVSKDNPKKEEEKGFTIDSLTKNIPLSSEQKGISNSAIIKALLSNALTFQNQLEDFPSAIEMYEELARRFPESSEIEETLFNLAYCYKKNKEFEKSDSVSAQLKKSFPNGTFSTQIKKTNTDKKIDPAQQKYENIYRMFIEGKFDQAKEAKILADKEFGKNYWTPQLLYIESVYYIKQKEDSVAIDRLQNIVTLFGKSALAEKAETMIDVLKRRNEIEFYLTNLSVERPVDIITRGVDLNSTKPTKINDIKIDSLSTKPSVISVPVKELADLSNTNTITSAPPFAKKDTLAKVPTLIKAKEILNETKNKTFNNKIFSFNPSDTQYAVVVLDNVDPIFVSEGRNAFNRFNQDRFPDTKIEIVNKKITPRFQFLLLGPYQNAADAINYVDKTRPVAGSRIVPWLSADKFSFTIISIANLNALLRTQDVDSYRTFIHEVFPDKF